MTFDELWRLDLTHKTRCVVRLDIPEDVETFCELASKAHIFDDLDEAEIDRFIEWLEENV